MHWVITWTIQITKVSATQLENWNKEEWKNILHPHLLIPKSGAHNDHLLELTHYDIVFIVG